MTCMPNLDKLNSLLQDKYLSLPNHRRSVDASGRNLAWLRKNIYKRNEVDIELANLLDMPDVDLFKS